MANPLPCSAVAERDAHLEGVGLVGQAVHGDVADEPPVVRRVERELQPLAGGGSSVVGCSAISRAPSASE